MHVRDGWVSLLVVAAAPCGGGGGGGCHMNLNLRTDASLTC